MFGGDRSPDKRAYEQRIESQIGEWQSQVEVLHEKARNAQGDVRVQYQQQAADLSQRIESTRSQLIELRNSSPDRWEELKGKIEQTTRDLGDKFSSLKRRFGL